MPNVYAQKLPKSARPSLLVHLRTDVFIVFLNISAQIITDADTTRGTNAANNLNR